MKTISEMIDRQAADARAHRTVARLRLAVVALLALSCALAWSVAVVALMGRAASVCATGFDPEGLLP